MVTLESFLLDSEGRKFVDVIEKNSKCFKEAITFFNSEARLKRMEDSETHHERPAFSGVVKEFEQNEIIREFFLTTDGHKTARFRQAIGCLIKIHMVDRGWIATNLKGSLGNRIRLKEPSNEPGAYFNTSGLSKWFTSSKRYSLDKRTQ